MKKLFFIAAIAGAALVSCTKNELAPSATNQQEITFATPVVGTPTKVDLISTYPTDVPFGVFGLYYTSTWSGFDGGVKYMENVQVTHTSDVPVTDTDGGWVASGYYWPKNTASTLTFAAYSPYMGTGVSHDKTGIHFENYVVDKGDEDLLFSDRAYDQKQANETVDNPVYYGINIKFNHALSAILFKAKVASKLTGNTSPVPNYEFVITKIEVVDAMNKGSFNQNIVDAATAPTTPAASTSDWTIASDAVKTTYTAYSGAGITVNSTTATSAYGTDIAGKADLILLPQSLTDVKVKVTYNLRHSNMEEGKYIKDNVAEANLSYDPEGTADDVTSWLRGKRYIYTLTLDLDQIYFSPEMTGWDDVTVAGSQIL